MRSLLRPLVLLALGACQAPASDSSAFTTTPVAATVPDGSSSGGSSSSSGGPGTTTTGESGQGSGPTDMQAEPPRDLGAMPDFGGDTPAGCKGKIDFLFAISRHPSMAYRQAQLALAVPQFIATIESKFADFDYHIMVIDGDGPPPGAWWGNLTCNEVCPNLACKIGEDCCPHDKSAEWLGYPCCGEPNYPCDKLDLVTECDAAWGAGTVFPAGKFTANKPCPIDGGRRYLVKGQTNLDDTFACIARVGTSGYFALGQALTAAMQKPINAIGGCNQGFLRDDALLMVTFMDYGMDEEGGPGASDGSPSEWAKAVIDAKHGDENSVVMLNFSGCNCPHEGACHPKDRLCELIQMFPYHLQEEVAVDDYGPAFVAATSLVDTACAGFVVPG